MSSVYSLESQPFTAPFAKNIAKGEKADYSELISGTRDWKTFI
jgi:hypothetical protein